MGTGGRTAEELERLLEDAVVLRDAAAVAELFEATGVLVVGRGGPAARGTAAVAGAAPQLWAGGRSYLAEPGLVLLVHGLALVAGAESVNVARRGVDGVWRYAISVSGRGVDRPAAPRARGPAPPP